MLFLGALAISGLPANAQCPAVGADTTCVTVLTVTDSGVSISTTGQGPYDGIDDALVGVVNNSSLAVVSIALTSIANIFGFDGDGVVFFGLPGNGLDSSGYGGPNAYFTGINPSGTSGTVNFITPIAAKGGTAYFSLENSLSGAIACSSIINNSVSKPPGGSTQISATFTPNLGYTIPQAAKLCGFINFDWQQTITMLPAPSPFFAAGSTVSLVAPPPFNDPPPNGYAYQNPPNAVQLPVYYNLFTPASNPLSLAFNETATTLSFFDAPADPCLPGGSGAGCSGLTAPVGSNLAFTTHLVGIMGALPGASVIDTGIGFSWTDTYNGTSGGIAAINSFQPVDPGSGTGGITVTSVNEITNYQYNGLGVTAVNGVSTAALAGPSITNYQIVSRQAAAGKQSFITYRADLINPGNAFGSVTATLTSLDPFSVRVVPGQGSLMFAPVPANSQVTSGNTFTILTDPTVPLDLTKLQWTFQTTAAPVTANAGSNQTVKVGSLVTLDGSTSTNLSGAGTLTYDWKFTSRPPGTATRLFYETTPTSMFVADVPGNYAITLTVGNGTSTNSTTVIITATP